jgi:DNA-directed RNA polymerase subunit RPC12/RpoP
MDLLYELNCEHCGAVYEVLCQEQAEGEQPIYCPFCSAEIAMDDIEEEFDDDVQFDFDIEDDERR